MIKLVMNLFKITGIVSDIALDEALYIQEEHRVSMAERRKEQAAELKAAQSKSPAK